MSMLHDILCVILARGGSKGIPGKNLKLLGGIPLVAHSILHAKQHLECKRIIVSSDDHDILTCAIKYGVLPLIRPDRYATDEASSESALINAVEAYWDGFPEDILFLQPTSPIRFKDTIPNFVNYYRENNFDSCLTITKFHNFFWNDNPDGAIASYNYLNRPRRQDLGMSDLRCSENGNAYLMKREMLLKDQCRLGGRIGVFPISELEAMQIDTPEEFAALEAIFEGKVSQWTGVDPL